MNKWEKAAQELKVTPPNFTAQFNKERKIDSHGRTLRFVSVRPEEETGSPVVIAPGFASTSEAYKYLMLSLYKGGREVVIPQYNLPKGLSFHSHLLSDTRGVDLSTLVWYTSLHSDDHKVDILAHSQGAFHAVAAAQREPQVIGNLVLVAPASISSSDGMLGIANLIDLQQTEVTKKMQDQKLAKTHEFLREQRDVSRALTQAYIRNNFLGHVAEAWRSANGHIQSKFTDIQASGIRLAVIAATDDKTFPLRKLKDQIAKDHSEIFYEVPGTHSSIKFDPDFIEEVIEILSQTQ
jgi:pimeloyl-ACP methyl ester carboxylesterase